MMRRRRFLADVGRGMLVASVGPWVAEDLGLASRVFAEGVEDQRLTFGPLEPLVGLMQNTPADQLLPVLVGKLRNGIEMKQLVAAAALANARSFGGQDYEGYHAMMALAPAYQMSRELSETTRALPVLKVLHRNTNHIQQMGGSEHEALHRCVKAHFPQGESGPGAGAMALRAAVRGIDLEGAERTFAALTDANLDEAYNDLQYLIQDHANVHRVVLAWRAWALLDLTGKEYAHTLLRQSVRFCVQEEQDIKKRGGDDALRTLLPRLLDRVQSRVSARGDKKPDDAWVDGLCRTIFSATSEQAAEAVAEALVEGIDPEAIGEAMSLAANRLVLCDPGRSRDDTAAKPKGSVHGASVGVHASDAANAWRNIARVSDRRNALASLIVGAYHTAGQSRGLNPQPFPASEQSDKARALKPEVLISETDLAIKANDQAYACALIAHYGELGLPERPIFDLLLGYAISEDGALHAEKYYRTVSEEFATARPAFRWRHLSALARVTASEHGHPAPGVSEARRLLNV